MSSVFVKVVQMVAPRDTLRGRLARQAAAGIGVLRDAAAIAHVKYVREVEPGLFVSPCAWTPRPGRPLVSVVVPCFNTPDRYLLSMVDSVVNQTFGDWQLLLLDASDDPARSDAVARCAQADPRIEYVRLEANGGISANTNAAVPRATGDYVAFLDHDDSLCPHALNEVAARLIADPTLDVLYSDEDVLTDDGRTRKAPFFKPAWSPHMFYEVNYTNHLSVIRRSLLDEAGWLRPSADGAQDYDLLLRLQSRATPARVGHIPKFLYHWREAVTSTARSMSTKSYALDAGRTALTDHLARLGVECAGVDDLPDRPGWYRVRPRWRTAVAVLVAVSDDEAINQTFAERLRERTDCAGLSPVFVACRPDAVAAAVDASAAGAVAVIRQPFLPDDPTWLDDLVGVLALPDTTVVAPLLTARGRVVSAGIVGASAGAASSLYAGVRAHLGGLAGPADFVRDVDALDAAVVVARPDGVDWRQDHVVVPAQGYAVVWGHQAFRYAGARPGDGFVNANLEVVGRPRLSARGVRR